MPSETLNVLRLNLFGLVGPAPESLPFMGWENRSGLTVLWIASAFIAPILARGRARLRLQSMICLGLVVFSLGGALLFQSLPGFRLFRHPARMFLVAAIPVVLLVGTATQAMFKLLQSEPGLRRTMGRSLLVILSIGLVSTATLCWVGGASLGRSASYVLGKPGGHGTHGLLAALVCKLGRQSLLEMDS